MGYTTEFQGELGLDKPLAPEHQAYLQHFSRTRRMKRNAALTAAMPDPVREAVGLPIGEQGGYYVGGNGDSYGQDRTLDITDYNNAPGSQPGLWCQWVPNMEGTAIEWDGGEKFYNYIEWLAYIIDNFLRPWGYVLNGEVQWRGEDWDDAGTIVVKNNDVSTDAPAGSVSMPAVSAKPVSDNSQAPHEVFMVICKDSKGKARGVEKSTGQIFFTFKDADECLRHSPMFSEKVREHFKVVRCLIEVCED